MHILHIAVGTKILTPIADHPSGGEDPGKGLSFDDDIGVRFVIPQVNVIAWFELLDQVVLQNQCFGFGIRHNDVHILNLIDHDAQPPFPRSLRAEIGSDAVPQVLGLAHVEHGSLPVPVLIDARRGGQSLQFFGQFSWNFHTWEWAIIDACGDLGISHPGGSLPVTGRFGPRSCMAKVQLAVCP